MESSIATVPSDGFRTPTGQEDSATFLRLSPAKWTTALVSVHLLLGLLLYEPGLLANGDNAGYMILGESLRSGQGYRDLYLPQTPPHLKFPPVYPSLLALLGTVGGLQLFKLTSLALTSCAVALTSRLGYRWLGLSGGVLAGSILAVNPFLLDYGHYVMSEAPFTALLLLSIYATGRGTPESLDLSEGEEVGADSDSSPTRWWWLGLAAAAAAFLTRTVGLALLLGTILHPLVRGRLRRSATAASMAAAGAGGWLLYQRLVAPHRAGYLKEWLMVHPYDPSAGTIGVAGMMGRVVENLWTYGSWLLPSALTGLAEGYSGGGTAIAVAGVGLTGLTFLGWLARSLPTPGIAEITTFLYVAILAVWPSLWVDRRFLIPLLPLLILYLLAGIVYGTDLVTCLGRGKTDRNDTVHLVARKGLTPFRGASFWAGALTTAAVALAALSRIATRVPERVECRLPERERSKCQSPAFQSFFDAAQWSRRETPEDAVFLSAKPRLFYLKSGRKGRIYPYQTEPSRMLREVLRSRADYLVVDPLPGIGNTTRRYLLPTVDAFPNRFETVYDSGDPPTAILRISRRDSLRGPAVSSVDPLPAVSELEIGLSDAGDPLEERNR